MNVVWIEEESLSPHILEFGWFCQREFHDGFR